MSAGSWWRTASPVPFTRGAAFVVAGRGRADVSQRLIAIGARADDHGAYHLTNAALADAGGAGPHRALTWTVVRLRARPREVEVHVTYREGLPTRLSGLAIPTAAALLLVTGAIRVLTAAAGSHPVGGMLFVLAGVTGLFGAPFATRRREPDLCARSASMDGFLRHALGVDEQRVAVATRSARRSHADGWQAVALACAALTFVLGTAVVVLPAPGGIT